VKPDLVGGHCGLVTLVLYQDLKNLAIAVNGTPHIHLVSSDSDHHFVEMTSGRNRWRAYEMGYMAQTNTGAGPLLVNASMPRTAIPG
jgi:hypothetical protein